jgi:alpha-galactosidase
MSEQKIVLIGAGSLQFGLGTVGSILNSSVLTGSTVCLHDINEESLDLVTQACQSAIEIKKADFLLESTIDRQEALKNATFIINSIEVTPRFELWKQDYEFPRKFGNKQVMGENGGPGGLFHSLRIIPPILKICEDIEKICPDALFINFSNPMSRICLAIKRKFPALKFIGLCHEIEFAINHLPKILGVPFSNIEIKAGGLNHFGIILEARYRDTNKNAYPDIRAKAPSYFRGLNNLDVDLTRFILENYGYLPYTQDSHFGEYIHWAWEVSNFDNIRNFVEGYTASTLSQGEKLRRDIKKGKGYRAVKPDDERAIPIIEGILADKNYEELSVNLPNDDVITNLPNDLVIECPAIVNMDGLHPIKLGEFPKGIAALLRTQASVQDLVVESVLQLSKELALQALLADPVVDSYTQARNILEEGLRLQKKYLKLK